MGSVSKFVIRSKSGVTISAAGMRGWEELVLQRMGQYNEPIFEPLQFKRVATVPADKCLDFAENLWYEAVEWSPENSSQFEITKWKEVETNDQNSSATQNFYAPIQNVAGRDVNISNVTVLQVLETVQKAIEQDTTIPANEKDGLLKKVKDLSENPYISGIGSSLMTEALKLLLFPG